MRPIPWVFVPLLVLALAVSTQSVSVSAQVVRLPHEVQGAGATSPLVGQMVTVRGVITANTSDAFFIQTDSVEEDGDPNTSEGLYVTPATSIGVRHLVTVTGTVEEFDDGNGGTVTRLVGAVDSVISIDVPLPGVVPASGPLERFEGMRVRASVRSVGATGFDGSFPAVLDGVARPFREPGIDAGSTLECAVGPCNFTTFDGNPERLRVDADVLLPPPAVEVSTGVVMTDLVGPLHFELGAYALFPEPESILAPGGMGMLPAPPTPADEYSVASLSLGELLADEETQRAKASMMVRTVLNAPDIVAVQLGDAAVLDALALRIDEDAAAAGQPAPGYVAHVGGFLVKASRVSVVAASVEGADELFLGGPLFDRAPMMLRAVATGGAAEPPQAVTVLNSQLRSNAEVHLVGPAGESARAHRQAQAEWLASFVQSRQVTDPSEKLVSLGNFNAHAFNDGYVDVMGTVSGTPALPDRVVLASTDLVTPNLTNLASGLAAGEQYSSVGSGNAQSLDHVLVSANLLPQVSNFAFARVNADFPEVNQFFGDNPLHLSDRDPAVAYFTFAQDTTVPAFDSTPLDVVAEATGPQGAAVAYTAPTATDNVDGPVPVTCTPTTGSVFGLGSTPVSCMASDAAGNDNSVTFNVTVRDTTAPVVVVPPNITVVADSPAGRAVSFTVSASDAVTAVPTVVCSPASGSTFPVGTTTVNCQASDFAGNSSAASFTVTVNAQSAEVPHRMHGVGILNEGKRTVTLGLDVRSPAKGNDHGAFALKVKDHRSGTDRRVEAGVFNVRFSKSGRTVRFRATAPWNGKPGYRFDVTATDRGPRGRRDRFAVTITAPNGRVVESYSGVISDGDIVLRY